MTALRGEDLPLDLSEMENKEVINWLRIVGYYPSLQRAMSEAALSPGRSWAETLANIEKEDAGEVLWDVAASTLLYGRKTVRPISLAPDLAKGVARFARNWSGSDFDLVPPSATPDDEDEPCLVYARADGSTATLVYCSRRVARLRLNLGPDAITQKKRDEIGTVSRVRVEHDEPIAAFDIFELDLKTGRASLRVDDNFGANYFAPMRDFFVPLIEKIESDTGLRLQVPDAAFPDLFPLIEQIYEDGDDGRVAELRFDCTTGAVRTVYLRGKDAPDLRCEEYHLAGKEAVGDIFPFGVAVAWPVRAGFADLEAELQLIGTRAMGHAAKVAASTSKPQKRQSLRKAHVHKAYTEDEYRLVLGKLMERVAAL